MYSRSFEMNQQQTYGGEFYTLNGWSLSLSHMKKKEKFNST